MPDKPGAFLTRGPLPDSKYVVKASPSQESTIGTEGEMRNAALRSIDPAKLFAGSHIPQPERMIMAPHKMVILCARGGHYLPVRCKSNRLNRPLMSDKLADLF